MRTCEPEVRSKWKWTHSSLQKLRRGGAISPSHSRQASSAEPPKFPARSVSKRGGSNKDDEEEECVATLVVERCSLAAAALRARTSRIAITDLVLLLGLRPKASSAERSASAGMHCSRAFASEMVNSSAGGGALRSPARFRKLPLARRRFIRSANRAATTCECTYLTSALGGGVTDVSKNFTVKPLLVV